MDFLFFFLIVWTMGIPKTFTLLYFISLYFTIKLKRKFNIRCNFWTKRLLWCIITLKIKVLEQFFNLIIVEQTKFYWFQIKNWHRVLFLMGIWDLKIGKKHIFWLKNGSFCYETPTLVYHNSKNKSAGAVF